MKRAQILCLLACLVAPLGAAAAEPPQPVLRMELEKFAAIPGQPIVLRLSLLVPTWLPKPPVFPSLEVANVMVRLPARGSSPISERIDGDTWSGVTRAYRVYPMIPGRFRIPARSISITYADPRTRSPVTVELRTEELAFEATVPPGAEDLDPFIAAEALTLEQTIEGDPESLEPGDAFTRRVTAQVKGTSPLFLPPLISPLTASSIESYPQEPLVEESEERGILSGRRVERVTYVAEAGGHHVVPPIGLRWFNMSSGRVEFAEVSGFEVVSRGPLPVTPRTFDWRAAVPWIFGSALVLVLAGAILARLRPQLAAWYRLRFDAYFASETFAFKQATTALRARNFGETQRAVGLWSSRLRPLAGAQDAGLSDALAGLGAALYAKGASPSPGQWSLALRALQDARRARRAARSAAVTASALPPLNPRKTR